MSSFSHVYLVIVGEVVAVLHALVAADDVEQLVVGQEAGGHVRPEEAREAARVGEATRLVLKSKVVQGHTKPWIIGFGKMAPIIESFLKRSQQLNNTPLFLMRSAQLPHPARVSCSDLFTHG